MNKYQENIYRFLFREQELRETRCLYEEIYSGEGLGITLSSILQTFNLKMEKYEGKYKEIIKEPRAYVEGEGKRARNLS